MLHPDFYYYKTIHDIIFNKFFFFSRSIVEYYSLISLIDFFYREAWKALGSAEKENCMIEYVAKVGDVNPEWQSMVFCILIKFIFTMLKNY